MVASRNFSAFQCASCDGADKAPCVLQRGRLRRLSHFARADGHGQRRDDSMGVVVFPVHGTTCDVILRPADEALYQAKAQGCDRVVVAKPVHVAT